MRFLFHPQAEAELDDAAAYYDAREPGLGLAFAEEVYSTIRRIIWRILKQVIRSPGIRGDVW